MKFISDHFPSQSPPAPMCTPSHLNESRGFTIFTVYIPHCRATELHKQTRSAFQSCYSHCCLLTGNGVNPHRYSRWHTPEDHRPQVKDPVSPKAEQLLLRIYPALPAARPVLSCRTLRLIHPVVASRLAGPASTQRVVCCVTLLSTCRNTLACGECRSD